MEFSRPVKALASGLIDYAGLFPPASLPLDVSYENYRRYRETELSWMLERFVCPWKRIDDLESLISDVDSVPVHVSAIAPVSFDDQASFASFLEDVSDLNTRSSKVLADSIEVKWSAPASETSLFAAQLKAATEDLERNSGRLESIFVELPWQPDFPIDEYARLASRWPTGHSVNLGLKVRTGGVEASAFPEPYDLSRFISACYRHGVIFKATAGLHHPLRRWSSATDSMMHGFINLFWGATALYSGLITADQLTEVLEETRSGAFEVGEQSISWNGTTLSHEQLAGGRNHFARSFGSCSFAEPVQDLQSLNLLPEKYAVD